MDTHMTNESVNNEQDTKRTDAAVKETHTVGFHGRGGEFFGIWIVNILLTILTLGIYSAWAKVRTNRYFYGNTELDGDRFEYLATPMQILAGRIIAVVMLGIWALTNAFAPAISIILLIAFFGIFPFLAHKNMRFNMQMTRYRNIRFGFNGTVGGAYMAFLGRPAIAYIVVIAMMFAMSMVMSLGFEADSTGMAQMSSGQIAFFSIIGLIMAPLFGALFLWVKAGVDRYIVNGTSFGTLQFSAQLSISNYAIIALKTFGIGLLVYAAAGLIMVILGSVFESINQLFDAEAMQSNPELLSFMMIPIMFAFLFFGTLVGAYFKAHVRNYVFNQTLIEDKLSLGSSLKAFPFTLIIITNVIVVIFTLGLAIPWAQIRIARYMAENTSVTGDVSLTTAEQANNPETNAIGDEVAEAFDMEVGLV